MNPMVLKTDERLLAFQQIHLWDFIENMIEIKSAKTIGFIIFLHSDGSACVYDEDFSFHVKFSFFRIFQTLKLKI